MQNRDISVNIHKSLNSILDKNGVKMKEFTIKYSIEYEPPCCNGKDCGCGGQTKGFHYVVFEDDLPGSLENSLSEYILKKEGYDE